MSCVFWSLYKPTIEFLYAHVVMHMFELLVYGIILTLFLVPTIAIHIAQYKYAHEACQQFPTLVGD